MLNTPSSGSHEPYLADGTPLAALIDHDRREVAQRLFSDPEIYQWELKNIWAKSWIIVGHESEIPNPGDFVTRRIAEDPVIVTRRPDGSIDCVLNVCPHRGALVCREEAGNSPVFRCIYHGWIFNTDGSFRGAPFKEEMYPEGMDAKRLSLPKARVGIFGGFIFANWDESAPSLDDYLGDYKFYLNLIFNRTANGVEVLGPPQRFVINANWKTASEQFGGDAYHAGQLHRSLGALTGGSPNNPRDWQLHAPKVSTANGHNIICFDLGDMFRAMTGGKELSSMEKLHMLPPAGLPPEMLPEMLQRFSEEELELLATTPPSNGGMFPNAGVWSMYNPMYNGMPAPFLSFRTYVPIGPDKFEFYMWVLVAKGASEEYRDLMRRSTSFMQGAAGFIEGDDAEVWPGQTSAARGYVTRQQTLKYWAMTGDTKPESLPGEGQVHVGFSRDDPQWNWWKVYFDRLEAKV